LQSETVFGYVTNPVIFNDLERIQSAFVAMGARETNASQAAAYIIEHARGISLSQAAQAFSFNDAFVSTLSQDNASHLRCVDVMPTNDSRIDRVLQEVVLLYGILKGFKNGEWNKWEVRLTNDAVDALNRHMYGKFYDGSLKYMHIFPKSWEADN
jgi:hypothetical protein